MSPHKSTQAQLLGEQRFDGLGRQTSLDIAGRLTSAAYVADATPPKAHTLPDGQVIEYGYERALDDALTRLQAANDTTTFAYDIKHSLLTDAIGSLGRQTMAYSPSGKLDSETWQVDGESHVTRWRQSMAGLPGSLTDASGTVHERGYDVRGRLNRLSTDTVSVTIEYDDFSRPALIVTTDSASTNSLRQTLTYDDFDREIERVLDIAIDGVSHQITQTLTYTARDQLASRTWAEGSTVAEENYRYDSRGRLIGYSANDHAAPTDPFGNRIMRQLFTLNALDGNEQVISEFADGSQDIATFSYSPDDPTQVIQIDHTHASWPASLTVKYDPCGRVIEDGMGRTLGWDTQSRLINVSQAPRKCEYRYSPTGQLVDRELDGTLTRSFYSGEQLTHERTGDTLLGFIGDGSTVFAQSRLSEAIHTVTLLGCDAQGTLRVEADANIRTPRYSAHGAGHTEDLQSPLGFAGERVDELTGWYVLGSYRPYDPVLMCFLSPDSESPFGRGGLNPYAYCGGDPVNNIDPDGHGFWNWFGAIAGIALAVVGTVASLGAAAPALGAVAAGGISALTASGAMAITSATLGVASLTTGIASTVMQATGGDEKTASILGWVSFGTGVASAVTGIGSALSAAKSTNKIFQTMNRNPDGSTSYFTGLLRHNKRPEYFTSVVHEKVSSTGNTLFTRAEIFTSGKGGSGGIPVKSIKLPNGNYVSPKEFADEFLRGEVNTFAKMKRLHGSDESFRYPNFTNNSEISISVNHTAKSAKLENPAHIAQHYRNKFELPTLHNRIKVNITIYKPLPTRAI